MSAFHHPSHLSVTDRSSKVSPFIAGHFLETDTYKTRRPQGMSEWLITFTLNGRGYFRTNKTERTNHPGDITLLRPGTPHQYGTVRGDTWNFMWAHFSPQLLETKYFHDDELITHSIGNTHVQKRVYRAFGRVMQDYREHGEYWDELCENSLREILLLLARVHTHKMDPRIEQVLHILAKEMQNDIRIQNLAQSVGLSASRLSHLFKAHVGESIIESLNKMRLQEAALLLKHTDRSAADIGFHVGYQNYQYFAAQFKKQYGMSPRLHRANERQRRQSPPSSNLPEP